MRATLLPASSARPTAAIRFSAVALLLGIGSSVSAGDLLVSSRFTNNVLRYDSETGSFKGVFAAGNGLANPNGIAFGPDGNLYVGLGDVGRVMVFGSAGQYLRDFVTPSASGGLLGSRAIAFLPGGDLLVNNGAGNNVLRYESGTGRFLGVFATGSGMVGPVGLTIGTDGLVYVGAALSNRVYVFDQTGSLRRTLSPPSGESNVTGVEFDADGRLLVALSVSNAVRRFDLSTGSSALFVAAGRVEIPIGVARLPGGDIIVGSFGNDSVMRFAASTGAQKPDLVASGSGGLDGTHNFAFLPDGPSFGDAFDGAWVIPNAEQQGVLIDISREAGVFFAAMFTFDRAGGNSARPAWYVFQGPLGARRSELLAYQVSAGTFLGRGASALQSIGGATFEIVDCNNLRVAMQLEGSPAVDFGLQRIVPTATCAD